MAEPLEFYVRDEPAVPFDLKYDARSKELTFNYSDSRSGNLLSIRFGAHQSRALSEMFRRGERENGWQFGVEARARRGSVG
jgi:hypothetical protein